MSDAKRISAILFDFDGTITSQGHLDFPKIRREIGCPAGLSILEYIESLPAVARIKAEKTVDDIEMAAAGAVSAASGLYEILQFGQDRKK